MKKIIVLCLVLVLAVSLVGCGNTDSKSKTSETSMLIDESKPTWTVDAISRNDTVDLWLSVEDAVVLEELLSSDNWINDVTNCGVDVTLKGNDCQLSYHSECGTFNDLAHNRSLHLSENEKEKFNELLGKYVELGFEDKH